MAPLGVVITASARVPSRGVDRCRTSGRKAQAPDPRPAAAGAAPARLRSTPLAVPYIPPRPRTPALGAPARPHPRLCKTAAASSPPALVVDVDPPRGDTAGAAVLLKDVLVQAGEVDLIEAGSLRILPNERVGLVGTNGCGKSTLVKCIAGLRGIDGGTVLVSPGVDVGYLEQTAVSGSTTTVYEEASSRMKVHQALERLRAAEAAVEGGEAGAADRLVKAEESFRLQGGYEAERKISNVLGGLGFSRDDWERKCSEFSGGWQMRIALARLLLGPAGEAAGEGSGGGLLLLDEPTNHLDSNACNWLSKWLKSSAGGAIIVSHDEGLLDGACDRIVEVRGGKLHVYSGAYSKFLQQREERRVLAESTRNKQENEAAKLEGFVTRFGAKATKASAAQSKQKALDKLRDSMEDLPAAASGAGAGDYKKVALTLPIPLKCHALVMEVEGAVVGWGPRPSTDDEAAAKALVAGVDLEVTLGQRIVVLGPNGAGKSTLLKALSGELPLWGGRRKLGEGVSIGVFNQDLAQELPMDKSALNYVTTEARKMLPQLTDEKVRKALGALGLAKAATERPIGQLSGGEKARVALALFAVQPHNVLLLDEASNHLDAATLETLTGALRGYTGAIIAISHNQKFCESLEPTHVLRVSGGVAQLRLCTRLEAGDFDHGVPVGGGRARSASEMEELEKQADAKQESKEAASVSYEDRKKATRAKNRIEKLLKLMEEAEEKCAAFDEEMAAAGADVGKAMDLSKEKEKVEVQLEEYMAEWEELEALVEAAGI